MEEIYNIISVNCKTHDCEILYSSKAYNECVEYMNNYVDTRFDLDNVWLKCYHNHCNSVSIYKYYYMFAKEEIYKIHISKFTIDL
jgi:hypothetical protein